MTKAKAKSEFYKDTTIPNTLLDELMNQLPAMPTKGGISLGQKALSNN